MALFSLIAVLLIEQIWPLRYFPVVHVPLMRLAQLLEERFNAGEHSHGIIAWFVGVGGLVLIVGAVYALLRSFNPLLAWCWNVIILYLTMGFRQFSHFFTDIQFALRMDDLPRARELLSEWRGKSANHLSPSGIARVSILQALIASHRHVFGVLCCFLLFPGPCGAVLYRAAAFFAVKWGGWAGGDSGAFGRFSRQAFAVLDWVPARMTAAGFAVVGNFESAMYRWKAIASDPLESPLGDGQKIVLAAGAGALGLGFETPLPVDEDQSDPGEEGDIDLMQSAVGLVWRALLLWLLLFVLLVLARVMGS